MPHTSFITDGYEQIEKTVKPFGDNGAHVGIPKSWIGFKVAIIRLEEKPVKCCMVCPSTDGVKRYTTKNDGVFHANGGDGYVEYCTKHAKHNGYIE